MMDNAALYWCASKSWRDGFRGKRSAFSFGPGSGLYLCGEKRPTSTYAVLAFAVDDVNDLDNVMTCVRFCICSVPVRDELSYDSKSIQTFDCCLLISKTLWGCSASVDVSEEVEVAAGSPCINYKERLLNDGI